MKSEELLYSLEHVGEDLLAGAGQTVLVRSRRPWFGAAAAALVIVALGLGGLYLWKHLPGGSGPGAEGTEGEIYGTGDADGETKSNAADPTDDPDLPYFSRYRAAVFLAEGKPTLYARHFDDIEASLAADAWTGNEALTALPVYSTAPAWNDPGDEGPRCFTKSQLDVYLYKAAERFGAEILGEVEVTGAADSDGSPVSLRAETGLGTLTVYGDGQTVLIFNEDSVIRTKSKFSLEGADTEEQRRALRSACMEDCAGQVRDWLELGSCTLIPCEDWSDLRSSYHAWTLCPRRRSPAEQLKSRYFEQTRLLTTDGYTVRGVVLTWKPWTDFSNDWYCTTPKYLDELGDYPIITLDEAREIAAGGCFLYEGEAIKTPDLEALEYAELVYPTEEPHEKLIPYYRFWLDRGEGLYAAIYVPAIREEYLSDWSSGRTSALRMLTLGEIGQNAGSLLLTDPDEYVGSDVRRQTDRPNTLPVFSPPTAAEGLSRDGMAALLDRALDRLGAQATRLPTWLKDEAADPEALHQSMLVETDKGTLALSSTGEAVFLYNPELYYKPFPASDYQGGDIDAHLYTAFAGRIHGVTGLSLTDYQVLAGEAPAMTTLLYLDQLVYRAEIYPCPDRGYNDVRQDLIARCFDRIELYYRDGALLGFRLPAPDPLNVYDWLGLKEQPEAAPGEETQYTLTAKTAFDWTVVGNYPIISPEDAIVIALVGEVVGLSPQDPDAGRLSELRSTIAAGVFEMDLVYLPNEAGDCLLPFYRFLCPDGLDDDGVGGVWAVCYVPAVMDFYLTDYPSKEPAAEPTEPAETDPTEQAQITTCWYALSPVEVSSGRWEIRGPAGSVEAQQYLGAGCQSPVWADVDGDGETELIYWCYGPTSGLFTVGLCVYGLEEGLPVLEASRIICLTASEISLSEENGEVFFHYCAPQRWDASTDAVQMTERQPLSVTVRDGELLLNGGDLPADIQTWGDGSPN